MQYSGCCAPRRDWLFPHTVRRKASSVCVILSRCGCRKGAIDCAHHGQRRHALALPPDLMFRRRQALPRRLPVNTEKRAPSVQLTADWPGAAHSRLRAPTRHVWRLVVRPVLTPRHASSCSRAPRYGLCVENVSKRGIELTEVTQRQPRCGNAWWACRGQCAHARAAATDRWQSQGCVASNYIFVPRG